VEEVKVVVVSDSSMAWVEEVKVVVVNDSSMA